MSGAKGHGAATSDQEVLAFNLTDPDKLTTQLDAADLDEEETELLLAEALKLNARLKDALRHQQLEGTREHTSSAGKARTPGSRGRAPAPGGGRGHPLEEQLMRTRPQAPGGKAKLPPITAAGAKSKPGRGARPDDGGSRISPTSRKRQGSAKKRQVDNRPAWDDRFSYD